LAESAEAVTWGLTLPAAAASCNATRPGRE
jgi:hypothetical protein